MDDLGYDSLWVADHLRAGNRAEDPYLESWQLVAALGALTSRARVGVLVSAVTFRHPAVVAKMATALDHITGGRAVLGLGAAWFEPEHGAYGIPFGTKRERGERLAEAAAIARALFDRKRTTLEGRHYRLADALAEPKPIQTRLPILIGGSGEHTVLPTVARHADMWNAHGDPAYLERKLGVLRTHCAKLGRDPSEIEVTSAIRPLVVRDSAAEIEARFEEIVRRNHQAARDARFAVTGDVDAVARRLAEYWGVGVSGFIVQMPTPYDRLTIERLAREVRPRLLELIAA